MPGTNYPMAHDICQQVFGAEWRSLSAEDRENVAHDFSDAMREDQCTGLEYARRIGAGNLQSYADVMRARVRKGW